MEGIENKKTLQDFENALTPHFQICLTRSGHGHVHSNGQVNVTVMVIVPVVKIQSV